VTQKHTKSYRKIYDVTYTGDKILDVTGPIEVFQNANRRHDQLGDRRSPRYATALASARGGSIDTTAGLAFATEPLARLRGRIDTLLVAGGDGVAAAARDRALLACVRRTAKRARRFGSVCSGAFVLAEAGLLDGKRATTHWAACAQLARRYPRVSVELDPIFVNDGRLWTSAGVCAGLDLALALVEQDHGRELALTVARWLVLFLKRPGGQAQFSTQLAAQSVEHDGARRAQAFAHAHLTADLSIAALARRAAMSPRNFSRAFSRSVGESPARWVERVRVEAARRALEETSEGVAQVAARAGFANAETMRRAFLRRLGVSPAAYRARFRKAA
jgi:transcriptional regulator GlxA family with amidase domain